MSGEMIRLPLPGPHPGGFVQYSTDGGQTWDPPLPARDDTFGSEESHLIGLVCDQIARANPDLPIETCQAIARDIIALVREYS